LVWFKMTLAIEWAEKYRPRTLKEVVGNKKAVQDLQTWAAEWLSGIPEKRAVILYGSAGIGKTSSAHALARDLGWEVIELNASDQRTAGVIEKIAGSAASMGTFFGGKRLIILDEADNVHGTADRGGLRAIGGLIKTTLQPIVLIANDIYELTPAIRNLCLEIKFGSVQSRSMIPALKKVCESEGVLCSLDAIQQIAENAGGDFRSAMNDLQASASGKEVLEIEDLSTSARDVKENIFKVMQRIFKSTDCKKALEASRELDESPEDLVHWIDENLPVQYASKDGDLGDIRTGFNYLSKADLYLGRVKKRQNYRMWRYASMLMVCGAAISKSRSYPGFIKYQQPSLWRRLGQTRSKRDLRDNIASKIGERSFESMRYSRNNLLEVYSGLAKDEKSAVEITAVLGLELEELIYLSGSSKPSKKLQKIYDEAQELLLEGIEEPEEAEFFKNPVSVENNKEESSKQVNSYSAVRTSDNNTSDKNRKKTADGSETPGSELPERKQKKLNFSLDISSEVPGEEKVLENNTSDLPGSNISGVDSPRSASFTPASLTSVPDSSESLEKKVLDLSASPERQTIPESDNISESFEKQALLSSDLAGRQRVSSAPQKQRTLTNCEPVDNESLNSAHVDSEPLSYKPIKNDPENNGPLNSGHIAPKDSEPKSADLGAETAEVPKKEESKNQRTLFDF
jgi:replication factor C large subunit